MPTAILAGEREVVACLVSNRDFGDPIDDLRHSSAEVRINAKISYVFGDDIHGTDLGAIEHVEDCGLQGHLPKICVFGESLEELSQ